MKAFISQTLLEGGGNHTQPLSEESLEEERSVCHENFGESVVLPYEGEGRHARVQVNFDGAGSKWLVMEVRI